MNRDTPITILLVDDEAVIAMATKMALEGYGYRLLTAFSGEEAVQAFKKLPDVDLILMDINLGAGLDGTEAAAIIMAERDLPVVFLSSHTEPEIVAKTEKITSYGYVVKDSSVTVLDASIKMALKLYRAKQSELVKEKQAEAVLAALRKSEANYRGTAEQLVQRNKYIESILDNMPIGFAINTIDDGVARYLNSNFTEIYGWPKDVLTDVDQFFAKVYPGPEGEELKSRVLRDMASGDPKRMAWDDLKITTGSGEHRYISAMNIPIPDQNLMVSTVWDTTRMHDSLAALRDSEERYRSIFQASSDAMLLTAPDGAILAVNPAACRIFGRTEEEILRGGRSGIVDLTDPRLAPGLEERARTGRFNGELTFLRGNGEKFPGEIASVVFRDKDGLERTSMIIRDATKRRQGEQESERQLAEKELLLREVHHRIKNNIASIGSLLSLHLRSTSSPEAAAVLQDALGRINSMRILYDKLLAGESYKESSAKNYLESLADSIIALFPGGARIRLEARIADIPIDARRLFLLGIIVNELLTNIMKHAFAGRETGLIAISLDRIAGRMTLTVQDDGIGLPDGFDLQATAGFGLALVKMLSRQLMGRFSIECRDGTRSLVEFDL